MKKKYSLLQLFFFSLLTLSCNKFYTNKTRIKVAIQNIPFFIPNKKDTLLFKSISVIERYSFGETFRKFNKASLATKNQSFDEIIIGLKALVNTTNYEINFGKNSPIINDSIYKPLLADSSFIWGYSPSHLMSINFKGKADGIHLIVTVIRQKGCMQGTCSLGISFIYDFFEIKNGNINAYTSILRNRDASAVSAESKYWKPLPRDTRRVFKKLYKQKHDGKTKRE